MLVCKLVLFLKKKKKIFRKEQKLRNKNSKKLSSVTQDKTKVVCFESCQEDPPEGREECLQDKSKYLRVFD